MPTVRTSAAALTLGALLVVGCSDGGGESASQVMATTTIWADITEQVACGEIEVPSLVPPGADAHSYEPSVRDADQLRNAELVIANGLGLEQRMDDALTAAVEDGVPVSEVAHWGGTLDSDGREQGDPGQAVDELDPHLWMDPDRVAVAVPHVAQLLRDTTIEVGDDDLDRCAAEYVEELAALSAEVEQTLSVVPAERRKLVTNHETLQYFARRFGFEIVGAVLPSTDSLAESSPRDLDELAATMRVTGIDVVFADVGSPTRLARALTERLGSDARVVELFAESIGADGAPQSYVDLVRTDARLIADALAP